MSYQQQQQQPSFLRTGTTNSSNSRPYSMNNPFRMAAQQQELDSSNSNQYDSDKDYQNWIRKNNIKQHNVNNLELNTQRNRSTISFENNSNNMNSSHSPIDNVRTPNSVFFNNSSNSGGSNTPSPSGGLRRKYVILSVFIWDVIGFELEIPS